MILLYAIIVYQNYYIIIIAYRVPEVPIIWRFYYILFPILIILHFFVIYFMGMLWPAKLWSG